MGRISSLFQWYGSFIGDCSNIVYLILNLFSHQNEIPRNLFVIKMGRTKTQYFSKLIDEKECNTTFDHLVKTIQWEDGIRSKKGFTRFAKAMSFGQDKQVDSLIERALEPLHKDWIILGIYLNYYLDGSNWTPAHSHPKQTQLIISLGATRTLKVGTKDYKMSNGDVIVFGSSTHSIPIEDTKDARISIATFMVPI